MAQNISVPDIGDFEEVEVIEVLIKPGSRGDLGRPTIKPVNNKNSFMNFVQEDQN